MRDRSVVRSLRAVRGLRTSLLVAVGLALGCALFASHADLAPTHASIDVGSSSHPTPTIDIAAVSRIPARVVAVAVRTIAVAPPAPLVTLPIYLRDRALRL